MQADFVNNRLWQMTLAMSAVPAVYGVRQALAANSASTDDGADSFTTYNLLRVTYSDDLTDAEMNVANAALADLWRTWTICQSDLDEAHAPAPQPLYTLTFADGVSWAIERVSVTAMGQAYRCLCRMMH